MEDVYAVPPVSDVKTALVKTVERALHEWLVECAGQDLPDDLLALGYFDYFVDRINGKVIVSVAPKDVYHSGNWPKKKPVQFRVDVTRHLR